MIISPINIPSNISNIFVSIMCGRQRYASGLLKSACSETHVFSLVALGATVQALVPSANPRHMAKSHLGMRLNPGTDARLHVRNPHVNAVLTLMQPA